MLGEYPAEVLAEIRKFGGSETFIQSTGNKVSAAEAWLTDILIPQGERPWEISPTPVPDLADDQVAAITAKVTAQFQPLIDAGEAVDPATAFDAALKMREDVLAQAKEKGEAAARGMGLRIEDQLTEAGFDDVFREVIANVVATPAGILKGPVLRRRKVLKWGPDNTPQVGEAIVVEVENVDPLDFYPSPRCRDVNTGYLIERMDLPRSEVEAMRGVPGISEAELDAALRDHGRAGLPSTMPEASQRDALEGRTTTSQATHSDATIEALEFWGSVSGLMLEEWGLDVDEPLAEYEVSVIKIGTHVVKAVLNSDPLGRRPYFAASFKTIPGTIWGRALPEIISDIQGILNSVVRHFQNNQAFSSGPQVGVAVDQLPPGFDYTKMYPYRIWPFTKVSGTLPIHFFQAESLIQESIAAYTFFDNICDDVSGIPKYTYGNDTAGGAGDTASGLAMLMGNATKRVRAIIATIDARILRPLVSRLYSFNMIYDEDPTIKGDLRVLARGALALIVKEQQQLRRAEFLANTLNPVDMQIIGIKGRARLLRAQAAALDLPVDKSVPTDAEIEAQIAQAQAAAQAQAQGAPGAAAAGGPATGGTPPGAAGSAGAGGAPA